MGRRIIKKDDGTFALWSTVVDSFILDGVSKDEIVNFLAQEAREKAFYEAKHIIHLIEQGNHPYGDFMTYNEGLRIHRKIYE